MHELKQYIELDQRVICQCKLHECDNWVYKYYGCYKLNDQDYWICFDCQDECLRRL